MVTLTLEGLAGPLRGRRGRCRRAFELREDLLRDPIEVGEVPLVEHRHDPIGDRIARFLHPLARPLSGSRELVAIFLAIALGGTPVGAPIVGWVADAFGPR